jgi:spore germination protein
VVIHIVQEGDSVYLISRKYGVPMQKIIDDNGLEENQRLMIGQALVVMTDEVRYTVAPGQSLYLIAQYYGVTVPKILQANPEITDPSRIQAGQVIVIPFSTPRLGTMEVNGYAYSNIKKDTLARTAPHLTYISIFSYQVNPDGGLTAPSGDSVIQAAREKSVAPMMVVTNLKEGGGFNSDLAHTILINEKVQDTLLDNIVKILANGYYGLDIDFEYIFPYDRESYNNFLRKVTAKLHPLGYIVTTALAPKLSADQSGLLYEAHDYPAHGLIVDHVILMTYEWGFMYGPARAVAPIDQVEKVLQYAVSAIPNKKIFMGMPNYGYDWTLPFVQGSSARQLSNEEAVRLAARVGAWIQYDTKSQAPFFYYYDSDAKQHVVWFEDARSVQAKLKLVDKYNLGGVSYWTINTFFSQNWLVLDSMYHVRKVV